MASESDQGPNFTEAALAIAIILPRLSLATTLHVNVAMESATLAHFCTAAATAVLVGVGVWGISATKNSLELSERAWVTATGAELHPLFPFEKNKAIHFTVSFVNSGRQPALDLNWRIRNTGIDSFDNNNVSMDTIDVPRNTSCVGLTTEKGRATLTPGTNYGIIFDSIHAEPPVYINDRIIDGSKFYVALGCLAYTTFEFLHHSGFCYVLTSSPTEQRKVFEACASGFDAD
jgi:hypothetical protein